MKSSQRVLQHTALWLSGSQGLGKCEWGKLRGSGELKAGLPSEVELKK